MSDVYSDTYWAEEFDVTTADLDRIARRMRESRSAYDLTELARRVVRGRLRHGPEQSPAALPPWAEDPSVRLWDPAGKWEKGDRVLVWTWSYAERQQRVMVGEIVELTVSNAKVAVKDIRDPDRTFLLAPPGSENATRWYRTIEQAVNAMRQICQGEDRTDLVLLEHGERIVSRLLDALQADERFLTLEGRWFLRELLEPLSDVQIEGLFQWMLARSEPASTADLVPLVDPPLPGGDVGLFSLYAALLDRPERFANVGTPTRPLWQAVRPPPPPPERAVAAYYAYDPETFEILVQPGQRLTQRLAQRLQDLGLYDDIVTAADEF